MCASQFHANSSSAAHPSAAPFPCCCRQVTHTSKAEVLGWLKLPGWGGLGCWAASLRRLGHISALGNTATAAGIPSIHLDRMMNMQQADGQSQQHTPDNLYRASASALPCTSQDGALGLARRLVVPGTLIAFAIRMG